MVLSTPSGRDQFFFPTHKCHKPRKHLFQSRHGRFFGTFALGITHKSHKDSAGCKRRFCSVKRHQFAIILQIPGKKGIKNSRENRVCKCKSNYDYSMPYVLVRERTHLNLLPPQHTAASELCNVHPLKLQQSIKHEMH